MLPNDVLNTLQLMCSECLRGTSTDIDDLFGLLKKLDQPDFIYFRDWLKDTDALLYARVKRAQQQRLQEAKSAI